MANHDALTGLPNRRLFTELLHFELAEAHRNDEKVGHLFLDLDYFKEINNTLGHEAGDRLLRIAARRIKTAIRELDEGGASSLFSLAALNVGRIFQ
jgi:diguanylate cyclase (GGDEF)-like protein